MPDGFNEDRWLEIRQNRRILYSLMIEQGFTNHPGEWWHYNLVTALRGYRSRYRLDLWGS